MKINKKAAFATALLIVAGSLSACGGDATPSAGGSVGSVNAEPLTYFTPSLGGPEKKGAESSLYFQKIEERTGINIKYISVNEKDSKEQLSVLAASDDLPDIIETRFNSFPGGSIQKALADGMIISLNSLMEDGTAANLKKYMDSDNDVAALAKTDAGEYYCFPMIRAKDSYVSMGGMILRQDWLDELGLEMPKTIEDWDKMLRAFKEKKGATSALSGVGEIASIKFSFGIMNEFYIDNDKVKFCYIEPGYKDFVTQLSIWSKDGIFDPDFYTQDQDAIYAKVATGKIGAFYGYTGSSFTKIEAMKGDNPNMKFVPVSNPYTEKSGVYPVKTQTYRVNNIGAAISSTCKDTKSAATFLDYVYSDEGILLSNYGIEGESYTLKDGLPTFTDKVLNDPNGYSLTEALSLYGGEMNKPFIVQKRYQEQMYPYAGQMESLDIWSTLESASLCAMPSLSMTKEETDEYNSIMTDINTFTKEYNQKFITGSESVDKFNTFVENLQGMKILRAIEIQQAAYDRYKNR